MSEPKETKKKAVPKKTAAKKETVKKETTKKTTTKKTTTAKKTATKKAPAKKAVKPVEEKVVVSEEVKVEPTVEIQEPVVQEPQIEIEIPQVVSEPVNEEVYVEPQVEDEPVVFEATEEVQEPVMEKPAVEEPIMPTFEPIQPVDGGYKARPISEIMASTSEETVSEPVNEEVYAEPQVEDEPVVFEATEEVQEPVMETPVVEEPAMGMSMEPTYEPEQPTYEEIPSMEPTLVNNPEPVVVPTKTKKPKDVRTILLIALFVALFAFIMFMPQIQNAINSIKKNTGMSEIEKQAKDIEKKQNQEKEESTDTSSKEIYVKLVCTSTTTALEDYDRTVVETFEYNNKKEIMTSSKKVTYTFITANESYESLKTQCNENSLKYVDKKGYETACNYNDTEVVMEDRFNLATFSTIKDGTTIISANAKYKDKIDNVKTKLEALGYTCE